MAEANGADDAGRGEAVLSGAERLRSDPRGRLLARIAGDRGLHAVGGSVRDAALGRPLVDLDVAIERDAVAIAEVYAAQRPARLVHLGGERFTALRLVEGDDGWVDLWDLEGSPLENDLWRRDLTVNAIAVDLRSGAVRDPTGGRQDLARRRLRATRLEVFREDPLRVLRLARFAFDLSGFTVDAATVTAARSAAAGLGAVAAERVREELAKIVERVEPARILAWFERLALADELLPAAARATSSSRAPRGSPDGASATVAIAAGEEGRRRQRALGFAELALMRAGDPAGARRFLETLALRGHVRRADLQAASDLLAPAWDPPPTGPQLRLWLHRAGRSWREALALRVAHAPGVAVERRWREIESSCDAMPAALRRAILEPAKLVDGARAAELLGIDPGPELGAALAALRRAQVAGEVEGRAAAEEFLRARRRSG